MVNSREVGAGVGAARMWRVHTCSFIGANAYHILFNYAVGTFVCSDSMGKRSRRVMLRVLRSLRADCKL